MQSIAASSPLEEIKRSVPACAAQRDERSGPWLGHEAVHQSAGVDDLSLGVEDKHRARHRFRDGHQKIGVSQATDLTLDFVGIGARGRREMCLKNRCS